MPADPISVPVGVVLGLASSAAHGEVLAAAATCGAAVIADRRILHDHPELVALANLHSVRIDALSAVDVPALTSYCRERGVDRVFTFDDAYGFECLRANAVLQGTDVEMPQDKLEMRRFLRARGLTGVAAWELSNIEDLVALADRYPIVVKPRRGVSSRGIHVLRDRAAVFAAAAHGLAGRLATGELYAERFVEHVRFGPRAAAYAGYLSVDVFHGRAGTRYLVADRLPPAANAGETGSLIPTRLSAAQVAAVSATGRQIAEAFGGCQRMFHIELVHTGDGFEPIEVNLRLGGYLQTMSTALSGPSLVQAAFDAYTSGAPDLGPLDGFACYRLIHPPTGAAALTAPPNYRGIRELVSDARLIRRRSPTKPFDSGSGSDNAVCELVVTAPNLDTLHHRLGRLTGYVRESASFSYHHDSSEAPGEYLD